MPTYNRRQSVVFHQDVTTDAFGRTLGAFPVGPNSEQKWPLKGDTGVVSNWTSNGWLKVRLDRHGAIVTVRVGQCVGRASGSTWHTLLAQSPVHAVQVPMLARWADDGVGAPVVGHSLAAAEGGAVPRKEIDVRTVMSLSDGY